MKVAVLQQYLRSLAEPMKAGGATKIVTDLERTCQELDFLKDKEVADLADYVRRIQDYDKENVWYNEDDMGQRAKRLLKLIGKAELHEELKRIAKLAVPKLKELGKHLGVSVGGKKAQIVEGILTRLSASNTPQIVKNLTELKAQADAPDANFAEIERELEALGQNLTADEAIRAAESFGVVLSVSTREHALTAIRRKVLETMLAKERKAT